MKFTYYGHSCFLLETQGKSILFDPFISPNELANSVDIDGIECDYILVSHGHQDHIEDLVPIAKRTQAKVIGSWELGFYLEENGISNYHTMNCGGAYSFNFGEVYMTTAVHSSSYKGRYLGVAAGFVINNNESCFYYSGDTALTLDMQLLAQRFNIQAAALPIGGNYTMDYIDAEVASTFIQCDKIIGVHHSTFPPIAINKEDAVKYFNSQGKELKILQIEEQIEI